ncbi:thiol reductant ABC exporter subunit CydC [Actinoplanes sp. NPDC049265]|uniref:thiol reductant ABC exporter subunit CydC n=1 Tax=Actinoplanes sp. NPDC049265 TaxID=3363902 RepID=UPI00371BDB0C
MPTGGRGGWLGPAIVALLAGTGAAASGVGLMAVAAWLISRAALHPPVLHLMVAIVAVRAFGLARGVLRYVERLLGHDAALRVLTEVRVRMFRRLELLAPAGLPAFRRADLTQRLATDVDAVLDLLTRVVLPYAVAILVGGAAVAVVGALSPLTGVVLAAGLIVVGVLVPLLQAATARRADGRLADLRGELAVRTADLVQGLPDLIAYQATGTHLAGLAEADARLRRAERRAALTAGTSAAVTALVTGLCVLTGLAAGAAGVRSGALGGELLAVVVLTPLAVFEVAGGLPAAAQRFAGVRAALRRVSAVLTAEPVVTEPADPLPVPDGPHTLRLENVSAAWEPGRPAVRDLSLEVRPGERVALVGPSGSGKSTVAALLVKFLQPYAGKVTLDGLDLRDLAGDRVRELVGYLPEDAHLFDTTIEGNLRIGRPAATPGELRAALADARLLDWVDGLPLGLETPVGEHGMRLSGGQRRRLALARTLLAGFSTVILDEPTEHLDDETAAALTHDLLRAAGDRAVLLITHRADIAAEVDRVVAIGTPAGPSALSTGAKEPQNLGVLTERKSRGRA